MKTDMYDIETALSQDDYCEAMTLIGFEILHIDEITETDVYFFNEDNSLIVHFDSKNREFFTYPRANHKKLNDAPYTEGEENGK